MLLPVAFTLLGSVECCEKSHGYAHLEVPHMAHPRQLAEIMLLDLRRMALDAERDVEIAQTREVAGQRVAQRGPGGAQRERVVLWRRGPALVVPDELEGAHECEVGRGNGVDEAEGAVDAAEAKEGGAVEEGGGFKVSVVCMSVFCV